MDEFPQEMNPSFMMVLNKWQNGVEPNSDY